MDRPPPIMEIPPNLLIFLFNLSLKEDGNCILLWHFYICILLGWKRSFGIICKMLHKNCQFISFTNEYSWYSWIVSNIIRIVSPLGEVQNTLPYITSGRIQPKIKGNSVVLSAPFKHKVWNISWIAVVVACIKLPILC